MVIAPMIDAVRSAVPSKGTPAVSPDATAIVFEVGWKPYSSVS